MVCVYPLRNAQRYKCKDHYSDKTLHTHLFQRKSIYAQQFRVHCQYNDRCADKAAVEFFHLAGHPKTDTAYAWLHDTGTVLRIHPALSPAAAVRAFIVQEFRTNANIAAEA